MKKQTASPLKTGWSSLRAASSALLVLAQLLLGWMPGVTQPARKKPVQTAAGSLTAEQRALHVLNRFSFGPTPGQLALLEREGVDAWFQQQLHPEQIPDAALEARLAQYPAMQLPQSELVARFPTPAMLRQYNNGRLLLPEDSSRRAVWADAAFHVKERREAREAARATAQTTGSGAEALNTASQDPAKIPGPGATGPAVDHMQESGPATVAGPAPIVRPVASGTGQGAASEADKASVLGLPPVARMQRLLALQPDEMADLQASLRGPEMERLYDGLTPAQMETVEAMRSPERVVSTEVPTVRLLRDVFSERQLQAVMADFWLNHFSVYLRKNQNEPYLLPAYERETVLPNALGRFEDLLVATAKSPAMLVYLDNWQSVGPESRAAQREQSMARQPDSSLMNTAKKPAAKGPKGINENYARELMELHTLGVKGGYTQQDIIEVAKCFTGWTIDRPEQGGTFFFNPNRHQPGNKVVLGHTIHESGMAEGLEVLHLLATQPATAHFLSLKLAQRFVSDDPPAALVDRMSVAYLHSYGDIRSVLLAMFHSPEFWSAATYRAKVKTPLEFVASALRASGAAVSRPLPLVQALDRLGMPLYGMQTPNGYPALAEDWVSSNALLTRMNFALVLSGNRLGGTRVDWSALLGEGLEPGQVPDSATEARLEVSLLGQSAAPQTRDAALAGAGTPGVQREAEQSFRDARPTAQPSADGSAPNRLLRARAGRTGAVAEVPETPLATAAGLLLGSPDFQRR